MADTKMIEEIRVISYAYRSGGKTPVKYKPKKREAGHWSWEFVNDYPSLSTSLSSRVKKRSRRIAKRESIPFLFRVKNYDRIEDGKQLLEIASSDKVKKAILREFGLGLQ